MFEHRTITFPHSGPYYVGKVFLLEQVLCEYTDRCKVCDAQTQNLVQMGFYVEEDDFRTESLPQVWHIPTETPSDTIWIVKNTHRCKNRRWLLYTVGTNKGNMAPNLLLVPAQVVFKISTRSVRSLKSVLVL